MINNLLYLAFILSFLFMVICGVVFFIAEQTTANLIGFIAFAAISLVLLVISEKKTGDYKSFSKLSSKILLAIICGLTISVLMLAIHPFVIFFAIFIIYLLKGLFSEDKEKRIN